MSRLSCKKAKDRKKRIFSLCFERLQKFKRVRKLFQLEDEEIGFTFKEKKEKRNQSDKIQQSFHLLQNIIGKCEIPWNWDFCFKNKNRKMAKS